jgi:hypothetical protein
MAAQNPNSEAKAFFYQTLPAILNQEKVYYPLITSSELTPDP